MYLFRTKPDNNTDNNDKCKLFKNKDIENNIVQLKKELENSEKNSNYFDEWNINSLYFVLCSCIGINGIEGKEIGLNLLEKFINYTKQKEYNYVPKNGWLNMMHPIVIEKLYKWLSEYKNSDNLVEIDLIGLLEDKIAEFEYQNEIDESEQEIDDSEQEINESIQDKHMLILLSGLVVGLSCLVIGYASLVFNKNRYATVK